MDLLKVIYLENAVIIVFMQMKNVLVIFLWVIFGD